ncbi:hypothetical protein [Streptomyces sp. NPDC051684]|uniref:hypothetical protein n=1 Tax=Streptomyces sp. NPDC051684 TaxID=3365670 RepID=UPI003796815F
MATSTLALLATFVCAEVVRCPLLTAERSEPGEKVIRFARNADLIMECVPGRATV